MGLRSILRPRRAYQRRPDSAQAYAFTGRRSLPDQAPGEWQVQRVLLCDLPE